MDYDAADAWFREVGGLCEFVFGAERGEMVEVRRRWAGDIVRRVEAIDEACE
jgi:hypothetical protein